MQGFVGDSIDKKLHCLETTIKHTCKIKALRNVNALFVVSLTFNTVISSLFAGADCCPPEVASCLPERPRKWNSKCI